ncbi:MAG TPA: hypothetical protein VGH50_13160 [Candidatus Binatia bacterium]|jgi:hypothetical protein
MDVWKWIAGFLLVTFVLHGLAFTTLAVTRRRGYYFFLTGTFVFLTAIYFLKFEGWQPSVPGTDFPASWLLRLAATACTVTYLCVIYKVEGTWLWKLRRRR